jgi:hypothetical protein
MIHSKELKSEKKEVGRIWKGGILGEMEGERKGK